MLRVDKEHVVGGNEQEVGCGGALHEDARHAWRAYIAECVVLPLDAFRQVGVHEQMVQGVDMGGYDVAILFVHVPRYNIVWHHLLLFLCRGRVGACIHREVGVAFEL